MADRDSQLGGSRSLGFPINRSDKLGGTDLQDLYRFNLSGRSSVNLKLSGFKKANFNVELYSFKKSFGTIPARDKRQPFLKIKTKYFQLVGASRKAGAKPEAISRDALDAGEYLVRVYGKGSSRYRLAGSSTPVVQLPGPTPTPTTPTLSVVSAASIAEGSSGNTNLAFAVSLSSATTKTVSVNYATANGTAVAGSDYTATTGTLTFAPGETSKAITVPITGDTEVEANETLTLSLSNATNATLVANQSTGTILNDDSTPPPPPPAPGNSLDTAFAASIPNTTALTGTVSNSDTQDYYKFTINNGADFLFTVNGLQNKADVEILNSSGAKLSPDSSLISSSTLATPEKFIRRLEAGTYYFRVAQKVTHQTANYSIAARQLTDAVANTLPLTASTNPQSLPNIERYVGANSTADYYRFSVTGRQFLSVELTNLFGNLDVRFGKAMDPEAEWAVFDSASTSPSGSYGLGVEKFGGTLEGGTGTDYVIKVITGPSSQGSTYSLAMNLSARSTNPSITRDVNFGTNGSDPVVLGTVDGLTYFSASNGSKDGLYSTDGTLDGTRRLQEFAAPIGSTFATTSDNTLYFIANDGIKGNELWKLKGGTVTNVADIGTGSTGGSIQGLTAVGNTVYFRGASAPSQPLKLFKTTGTGAVDITGSLDPNTITNLTAFGSDALFFTGSVTGVNSDIELYRVLNTSNTADKIDLDINRDSDPGNIVQVNDNTLYVIATSNGDRPALFKLTNVLNSNVSSITQTKVFRYADSIGSYDSFDLAKSLPMKLFKGNLATTDDDVLYFASSFNASSDAQLMKLTNPVAATTLTSVAVVRGTNISTTSGVEPTQLTEFNGKMYFFAEEVSGNTRTTQLWSTNGTDAGTIPVTGLNGVTLYDGAGTGLLREPTLTVAGQTLFFAGQTTANGTELWRIVGNDAPEEVFDINAGSNSSDPNYLVSATDGVFFVADDGASGQELWFVGG